MLGILPKFAFFSLRSRDEKAVQEALNNIYKHAEAKNVNIQLHEYEDIYSLMIEDDGKGFDPKEIEGEDKGIGFKSMQNRLDAINGFLEINASPGRGCTILVEVNKSI